jgi:hypothetical protein
VLTFSTIVQREKRKTLNEEQQPRPFHGLLELNSSDIKRYMEMFPDMYRKLGE